MTWFQPTTGAIGEFTEICIGLIATIYLMRLSRKTKSSNYIVLQFAIGIAEEFITFIVDSGITSTRYALYAEYALLISRALFLLAFIYAAYRFHRNSYPSESVIAPLVFVFLFCVSTFLWFYQYQPNQPPSAFNSLSLLFLYTLATLYASLIYIRKIRSHAKESGTSFISEWRQPSVKQTVAYKGFATGLFFFTSIWLLFLFTVIGLISWTAWDYIVYVLNLFLVAFFTFTYLNYASEQTSFQAKLTGTTLFIVLSVIGILPIILFGDSRFETVSDAEEQQIKMFLIIIPVVILIISFVLPLLFRSTVLKNLNQVITAVQQVNAGNLAASVDIEANDEIGALSRHFNRMTASLQRYSDEMNDLVDERTAALNQSLHELKSTQAQLIQSEKMASLGELTAGIAHEIQNPLNFVNNFSEVNNELIDEMTAENDVQEIKAIAADIRQNNEKIAFHGRRADAIVKGMLQHSRQTKGVKELTDINALCDEYLRLSYHGLRAKDKAFNADFTTDFDESIGCINMVPQDMGRVLLNLFNNAFYAVNEKKKAAGDDYKPLVFVQTKKKAGNNEIRVMDNGSGIPQSVVDKIFQPFFTTKPTGQGTGLGLSLAYDIITKEHNGNIAVKSKEGEGSEFLITLRI